MAKCRELLIFCSFSSVFSDTLIPLSGAKAAAPRFAHVGASRAGCAAPRLQQQGAFSARRTAAPGTLGWSGLCTPRNPPGCQDWSRLCTPRNPLGCWGSSGPCTPRNPPGWQGCSGPCTPRKPQLGSAAARPPGRCSSESSCPSFLVILLRV